MMARDLPEARGTYVLIASVTQMNRLEIGRPGLTASFLAFTPVSAVPLDLKDSARALLTTWNQPPPRIGILITCSGWMSQSRSGTRRPHRNSSITVLHCWKRRRIFACRFPGLDPRSKSRKLAIGCMTFSGHPVELQR